MLVPKFQRDRGENGEEQRVERTREGGDAASTLAFRVLCALEPANGC